MAIRFTETAWAVSLVSVTVWAALIDPTSCAGKCNPSVESVSAVSGEYSSAPMSIVPPIVRASPSISVDGSSGAELVPAFTAGDPDWMWKLSPNKSTNNGSDEMLPLLPV